MFKIPGWCKGTLKPDYIIGEDDAPYMLRWWMLPKNNWFNIYLHKILRSDDDRALHDHPWRNISIILRGGYFEHVPGYCCRPPHINPAACTNKRKLLRTTGSVVFRQAYDAHRLEIIPGAPHATWTLFITGTVLREWGFWCPKGWVSFEVFTDSAARAQGKGQIGRGCE